MASAVSRAREALERGDHALGHDLLREQACAGDCEAQAMLGLWCMLDLERFDDAECWLRPLADSGNGYAAHNLAVLYSIGWPERESDRDRAAVYFQIAVDSGFEAGVASDPLWWKRR